MLSFWEQQSLVKYDFAVVGAGIMGCSVAYELRQKYPHVSIVLLERGIFPTGASTKNAGFACFGSPTEILSDIELLGEAKALEIIAQRVEGLKILTERLNDDLTGRTPYGGYELILDAPLSQETLAGLNEQIWTLFGRPVFEDVTADIPKIGFQQVRQLVYCSPEAQIDSGKMMSNYRKLLLEQQVDIINGAEVLHLYDHLLEVHNPATGSFTLSANRIFFCTNAFISETFPEMEIKPGRGQVILTNEIENLPFKGSFHFEEGYYYFRNVGKRVLFGGGRNLDMEMETSTALEPNERILSDLRTKLKEIILPGHSFVIEQEWQGIMGFSVSKSPVIKQLNPYASYVMSCNGMGVALSPYIARKVVSDL